MGLGAFLLLFFQNAGRHDVVGAAALVAVEVHVPVVRDRLWLLVDEPLRQRAERLAHAGLVRVHAGGVEVQGRDAGPFLDDPCHTPEVRASHGRDGRTEHRNELRVRLFRRFDDIGDVLLIVAQNGIVLPQPRNEDEAVGAVPPGLVVGRVGGVAPGRVVHDEQSAEFVERGTNAAEVRRVVDRIEGGLVGLFGAICVVRLRKSRGRFGLSFRFFRNSACSRQPLRHNLSRADGFLRQDRLGVLLVLGGIGHQSAEFRNTSEPEEPGLVDQVHKMVCAAVVCRFLADGENLHVWFKKVFRALGTHSPVDHRKRCRVVPVLRGKGFPLCLRFFVQRAAGVREHRGHPEPAGLQQSRQPEGPGRGGGVDRDIPAGQRFGSLRQRLFGFFFVRV